MGDYWNNALIIASGALSGAVVTLSYVETKTRVQALWLLLRIAGSVFGLCYGVGFLIHNNTKIPHPWSESTAAFIIAATAEYHAAVIKGIVNRVINKK